MDDFIRKNWDDKFNVKNDDEIYFVVKLYVSWIQFYDLFHLNWIISFSFLNHAFSILYNFFVIL